MGTDGVELGAGSDVAEGVHGGVLEGFDIGHGNGGVLAGGAGPLLNFCLLAVGGNGESAEFLSEDGVVLGGG
jgi:hypothetical protein